MKDKEIKARFLITNADERTWKFDRPVLFLGEWCKHYNRQNIWSKMDEVVALPYGLNENQKDNDYVYVRGIVEKLLVTLKDTLNNIHGTNHSIRYWRIMLGYWLHRYVAVIFNRYFTLKQCIDQYHISGTTVFRAPSYHLATPDSDTFGWACDDEIWNNILYGKILKSFPKLDLSVDYYDLDDLNGFRTKMTNSSLSWKKRIKRLLKSFLIHTMSFFSRQTDAFIINSYLSIKMATKLQLSLGQAPILWRSPQILVNEPDQNLRDRINLDHSNSEYTGFEHCVRSMLFDLLPTCYLEGYESLLKQVKNLPWPDSPKFIFTSNNFDTDEVFKEYTAEKVERGIPYYTGQHGNNYGTRKFQYCETECIETSDKFLTWGWTDSNSKYIPVFNFKTAGGKPKNYDQKGGLLLIEISVSVRINLWDVYPSFKKYQEDQFVFVKNLPGIIHQALTVRLFASFARHKWFENLRWKYESPNTKIEYGSAKILSLISKSRLVVFSYDSTGLLETLSLNIPTICFWNGGLSHLRESAKPYYKELQQAGILHDSPESAAQKVAEIWDDIYSWWNSEEVQYARKKFCDRFSKESKNPVKELKKLMLEE